MSEGAPMSAAAWRSAATGDGAPSAAPEQAGGFPAPTGGGGRGVGVDSEADRRARAAERLRFELSQFAQLKEGEREGIERCRMMFEAMGPPAEVILEPGPVPGCWNVRVPSAADRHARHGRRLGAMAAAWHTVAADFIGPRRRGCIQRDENGKVVIDMAGAVTPWPTGERKAAGCREAPAASAAGGV